MSRCLHHNTLGCIAQCPSRCCLRLCFSHVGPRLLPHELRQGRGTVAERCGYHARTTPDVTVRCLSRPGPVESQVFLFSLGALFLLHDLLASVARLEIDAILERAVDP